MVRHSLPLKQNPLLLVTGDEFLRRSRIESVLADVLPKELRATHLYRVDPDELACSSFLAQAKTPSLLGGVQVFWISRAERMKKDDLAQLEAYLKQPAEKSMFIFEADELPESHGLVKLARRFGTYAKLDAGAGEEGLGLLRDKIKRAGKRLTSLAWETLEDRLAGSARLMDLCLDQLILYSDAPTIDEPAVSQIAAKWLRYEPFDLTEAIAQKDMAEALRIFRYLYELSGDATSAVGLIHWQLRRIWQAKKMWMAGKPPAVIGQTLRIPAFRLQGFLAQVGRFDLAGIEQLLEELWALDWKIKRGAYEESVALETFLAGVC